MTQNKSRDEQAEKWVFETNGQKWSNNNDECADNFSSFQAGFNAAEKQYMGEIEYLRRQLADERSGDCDKDKTIGRLHNKCESLLAELADKDLTIQVISKNSLDMEKDLEIAEKKLRELNEKKNNL